MKTIKPNLTVKPAEQGPELIKDVRKPVAEGKGIGALIAGRSDPLAAGKEPTMHEEEAHWRQTHPAQPFTEGRTYEEFHHAYRTGYEGYDEFGTEGRTFEETETKLRERYETENGSPKLPWTVVRPASHAAWHRSASRPKR